MLVILLFLLILQSSIACAGDNNRHLGNIRRTLDSVTIPLPSIKKYPKDVVLYVNNQSHWDDIGNQIKKHLRNNRRNIEVVVNVKQLLLGDKIKELGDLNYPDANIKINGKGVECLPSGHVLRYSDEVVIKDTRHYSIPYSGYSINDIILDEQNKPISFYSVPFTIDSMIEAVNVYGTLDVMDNYNTLYKRIIKTWRFKIDLPDLDESQCDNFYILLTRNWTSCRHKVVKIKDGYLYFHLKSDDAPTLKQMTLDPNSDVKDYRTKPRCRLINSPFNNGIYIKSDSIFIPERIKQVRIGKGGRLFAISNCHFNSFEISGFRIVGTGNYPCISVKSSSFSDQMWIKENTFCNLSSNAVLISKSGNVSVSNNIINGTRVNAIRCNQGNRVSINGNILKDIGTMAQTLAISFSGTDIHVYNNLIEDFNYSAIGTGGSEPNNICKPKSYIIEHNIIRYTPSFLKNYKGYTLADGGGIYIGPQNTQGIIRYNIIDNITGIGSNRGVFLDDGAKNLAIYGNLIMNTANSYDIDLRLCKTYAEGIPDHNTNNQIFHNIMTGNYRFEENNDDSNCFGGYNVLLGIGKFQKRVVKLRESVPDKIIKGCTYKNGVVVIPKQYSDIIDSTYVDSFVRNHISIQ